MLQHALLLKCAGGYDQGAHTTGGVVPELRVGGDVDITLVDGHLGLWVTKEGVGHGAVLTEALRAA